MPLLAKLSHQTLVVCYVLQVGAQAITELGNAKTDNLTNYLVLKDHKTCIVTIQFHHQTI